MKLLIICIVAGLVINSWPPIGFWGLHTGDVQASEGGGSNSGAGNTGAGEPVACVNTTPLKHGSISETIVVYGSIIAAPGALLTVSIPFESQVLGIMVNEGQKVSKGDILLKIKPSPDTMLQLDQARNAHKLARESYRQMEDKRKLRLATNDQMIQARQALDQAQLGLENLKNRGIDGENNIPSRVGGLIKKVYVREGSIVPAGNPIIDVVAQNRIEVLLGVEPEDIKRVREGQTVSLTRVNAPAATSTTGRVRKLSYAVNPSTRLVDVFVTLTSPAGFLLGESIEGKIILTTTEGLIVPRTAVLPEGDRHVLYTVKNGRAVKHIVTIGIENAKQYQVSGKDLQAGVDLVVLGNYELTDGMAVKQGACK